MNVFDILREKLEEGENKRLQLAGETRNDIQLQLAACYSHAIEIINQVEQQYNNGWIPVSERYPESDSYILLSFENFSLPTVGRYEEDEEGGAFFVGDDDISCVSSGLYVNAWRPLPAIYKDGMSMTNADRIRSMSDEELAYSWPCPYDTAGSNIMPCMLDDDVKDAPTEEYCHKCIMNWLQKEVKE